MNWEQTNLARMNYRDKLARENREVETLTEEQHEALELICKMRHELHMDGDRLWNSQHSTNVGNYLSDNYDDGFEEVARRAGLPELKLPYRAEEFYDDDWEEYDNVWYDLSESEQTEEKREELSAEYEAKNDRMLEETNSFIEAWLRAIDKEHNTNYCPSGVQRI